MALTQVSPGMLASDSQYTGFKNRIINGAMVINQRGFSGTVTTDGSYTLDRFVAFSVASSKYSISQNAGSVTPPVGFSNYLGVTSLAATSLAAGDYYDICQRIEGYNMADLNWGTANAKTVTLSFWVYSSLTGTFGGSLQNGNQNRAYPFTYTISSANTWTQASVTIAGDTSGTWSTTNTEGIGVYFSLGMGTTYSGTAGAWTATTKYSVTGAVSVVGTNGATWYVTGVQLEKGSTATSFDYRPYGTELALCQRYCKVYKASDSSNGYTRLGYGPAESTTQTVTQCPITTQMRISPSITTTGTFIFYDGVTITDVTTIVINTAQTPYLICLSPSAASGLTATRAYELATKTGGSGVAIFSAEL